MIYVNILDNLPAIIGLSIAGVWLIYKSILITYRLNIIMELLNWLKHRPLIMPSLLFILSPFISTLIFHVFLKNSDEFLKAFTPITCIAAYIAYQQYQINRQQLRKNLSDKRLQIYVSAMTLVSSGRRDSTEIIQEKINSCLPALFEAEFLFGEEVYHKLIEIYEKANELIALKNCINDANNYGTEQSKSTEWYNTSEGNNKSDAQINGEQLNSYIKKLREIREWFIVQTPKIKPLFEPYINLSNIAIERDKNYNSF